MAGEGTGGGGVTLSQRPPLRLPAGIRAFSAHRTRLDMAHSTTWQGLGRPAPATLSEARLQLHWAAQVVAAAGFTHLPHRPDDSHTSLRWDGAHHALVGEPLTGSLRAGLRLADLSLLLTTDQATLATFPLDGRTLDEAYLWLGQTLGQHTEGTLSGPLGRRDYDMPAHPVQQGKPFDLLPDAMAELARWYADAALLLAAFADSRPEASAVRCWPHHFDLATLVTLAPGDGESARTVGLGMTPGDGSYAEPYFYVTPWPYPDDRSGPPLPGGGRWHVAGWFGAVLVGSVLPRASGEQANVVSAFLDTAFQFCADLAKPTD